jgi:pyridoxal phosphate enzyme (YggS family)
VPTHPGTSRRDAASPDSAVATRLEALRARIAAAEAAAGRSPGSVTLVAVGKTFDADALRAAAVAGARVFGENYLQEALAKQEALAALDLEWHFIGAVQSRKARALADHFDWVQTVDREKIARRLAEARAAGARMADRGPLQICIQVNLDAEASKAGVTPDGARSLVDAARGMPGLRVRGLMAIPAPRTERAAQQAAFERLAALAAEIRAGLPSAEAEDFDVLSMGMSADLEAAIAAGATHVRIGSALFGPRRARPPEKDAAP